MAGLPKVFGPPCIGIDHERHEISERIVGDFRAAPHNVFACFRPQRRRKPFELRSIFPKRHGDAISFQELDRRKSVAGN
jgi:hypothetical protein